MRNRRLIGPLDASRMRRRDPRRPIPRGGARARQAIGANAPSTGVRRCDRRVCGRATTSLRHCRASPAPHRRGRCAAKQDAMLARRSGGSPGARMKLVRPIGRRERVAAVDQHHAARPFDLEVVHQLVGAIDPIADAACLQRGQHPRVVECQLEPRRPREHRLARRHGVVGGVQDDRRAHRQRRQRPLDQQPVVVEHALHWRADRADATVGAEALLGTRRRAAVGAQQRPQFVESGEVVAAAADQQRPGPTAPAPERVIDLCAVPAVHVVVSFGADVVRHQRLIPRSRSPS